MSLPSRECGLKFLYESPAGYPALVTPFTGVWIEMQIHNRRLLSGRVTPFTGVWIEILSFTPSRCYWWVTPFTGVWIEMS